VAMDNQNQQAAPPTETEIAPQVFTEKKSSGYKWLIFAVLVVVLLMGAGVGVYLLNTPGKKSSEVQVQVQPEPISELKLALVSPVTDTVSENNMITVSGTTNPNATVVVFSEDNESVIQSDSEGNFFGEIELVGGINTLSVTAFSEDGQEKTVTQEVVYDDQVLGKSIDSNEKSSPASNKERKFVENTLDALIKENRIDKNTKFVDERNKPVKANSVKPNAKILVISDSSDASDSSKIRKAVKVISRSATESAELRISKRRAVQGMIVSVNDSTILLTHQTQKERQFRVVYNSQTVINATGSAAATATTFQVGQRIVAVGNVTETGEIVATRIHIIPGKATGLFLKQPISPYPTQTSTPSATPWVTVSPTASPSATPMVTISPSPTAALPTDTPSPN